MVAQVAGVDEAGRGALVGNVVAAAVILPAQFDLPGLTDSKKLSARQREVLFDAITAQALAWCAAVASPAEIDAMNIHHATLLAMRRAVEGLAISPQSVLVDGKFTPDLAMPARAIVGGDASEACIAAASIIAKVTRDRQMMELEARFPGYGLPRIRAMARRRISPRSPASAQRRNTAAVMRRSGR